MPKAPNFQLEIAPLTSLPLTRQPFYSYQSREKILPGSLVEIPFGNQTLFGIVYASKPLRISPPDWLKSVKRLIQNEALTQEQRILAQSISETTFTPLGIVLKHFVVPEPKRPKIKEVSPHQLRKLPSLSTPHRIFLKKLLAARVKKISLWENHTLDTKPLILNLLRGPLKEQQQILLLVPEVLHVAWWQAELQNYFSPESVTIIHSRLTKATLSHHWKKIQSGTPQIILGTRQALFSPFKNLGLIFIFDAEDETSYKQWEMSPRYETLDVAKELSLIHGARILLHTPTPSLRVRTYSAQQIAILPANASPVPEHTLVNLRMQYKPGRDLTFSPELLQAIQTTLKNHRKAFLIARQQGLSSFSVCTHCKQVFRCPQCTKALSLQSSGHYECRNCSYQTSTFPACFVCGGLELKGIGSGTEKLESLLQRFFPKESLLRLDTITINRKRGSETIIQELRQQNSTILIGTEHHLLLPDLPETSLIAMIEADAALSFPDYRSEERLSASLIRASRLMANAPHGTVLLQTFSPEQLIFQDFYLHRLRATEERLFDERKLLHYPPFARFLKLECTGKNSEEAMVKRVSIEQSLIQLKNKHHLKIDIVPAKERQHSRRIHQDILIKIYSDPPHIPLPLEHYLRIHSKDFIVDRDPLHLQ